MDVTFCRYGSKNTVFGHFISASTPGASLEKRAQMENIHERSVHEENTHEQSVHPVGTPGASSNPLHYGEHHVNVTI
jgi:hypothetical protein